MFNLSKPLFAIALAGIASAASAVVPFEVRYESEAPGIQLTTATFNYGGVETFTSLNTGTGQTYDSNFSTSGAGTTVSGHYTDLQVNNADQYGGADGIGKYAVTFTTAGYGVDLSTDATNGINYFGYWLSALDSGNQVSFYHAGTKLFTFSPSDVINAVNATATRDQYYTNPNANFAGQNNQPYIFLNFFAPQGITFDRVEFSENPLGGGYESDNHTVGNFLTKGTGTKVPLFDSVVPEPATWAMMIAGFGFVGVASRRRKSSTVAA